jgi:hypothetical protein
LRADLSHFVGEVQDGDDPMPEVKDSQAAGYRYLTHQFQYSGGAAALDGFQIEHVTFHAPVPLAQGFAFIERYLPEQGVPLLAFCACELRSPAQFTDAGFVAFNRHYCGTLQRWGVMNGDDNPVARSNVIPLIDPPTEPSFHAFCFARPKSGASGSFVIAGSGEADDSARPYRERMIRPDDTSQDAMREKGVFVLGRMESRMAAFGFTWADTTDVQVYTVHDLHPFLEGEIARRGAARQGLIWHLARPPVQGLEYEMDCRSVPVETRIRL